jgi:hypothetical protein
MRQKRSENSALRDSVRVAIKVTAKDRAKALALLVRHSPGMALPDGVFVLSPEAVQALRKAKIRFSVIASDHPLDSPTGAIAGERI